MNAYSSSRLRTIPNISDYLKLFSLNFRMLTNGIEGGIGVIPVYALFCPKGQVAAAHSDDVPISFKLYDKDMTNK